MTSEREGGEQERARAASWFLCRVQVCKKRRKRGSKACQRAAEGTSEGAEERRGRERWEQAQQERECERVSNREGPRAREHALHVTQSVHMASYEAVVKAECEAAARPSSLRGSRHPETTSSAFHFNNKKTTAVNFLASVSASATLVDQSPVRPVVWSPSLSRMLYNAIEACAAPLSCRAMNQTLDVS